MLSRKIAAAALLLWAACAAGPEAAPEPDFAGERIDIRVLRGGFVESGGHRVPLEDCILRLRQRLRPLTKAQRQAVWVHVEVVREVDPQLRRDLDRLMEELGYMGLGGVEVIA